jgi:hypothetical protein
MSTLQIELSEDQRRALDAVARARQTTAEQVAKEAVVRVAAEAKSEAENAPEEHQKFLLWREALLGIEGMWKDRTDLPDFAELRRSWDRDVWNR